MRIDDNARRDDPARLRWRAVHRGLGRTGRSGRQRSIQNLLTKATIRIEAELPMVDVQMKLMKKAAQTGGSDDAWRYGAARVNGIYELHTGEVRKCRRNLKEGVHWLEIAAKQGCVGAMVELGVYYWQSNPTHHDDLSIALYWEKKAWLKGELLGAVNMAIIYALRGDGGRCNAMINW